MKNRFDFSREPPYIGVWLFNDGKFFNPSEIFMIQLTPAWLALEAQCTTPALIAQYDRYTIMLLNGYMGFGLAIDYMTTAIRATTNA